MQVLQWNSITTVYYKFLFSWNKCKFEFQYIVLAQPKKKKRQTKNTTHKNWKQPTKNHDGVNHSSNVRSNFTQFKICFQSYNITFINTNSMFQPFSNKWMSFFLGSSVRWASHTSSKYQQLPNKIRINFLGLIWFHYSSWYGRVL